MTSLHKLQLDNNKINKIQKISKLVNLSNLNLSDNEIIKIEGLSKLIELTNLNLSNNKITKIRNFSNLIRLNNLSLQHNEIKKIKNLDSLINLESLCLSNNNISKMTGFDKLINLSDLYLSNNKIKKIEVPKIPLLTLILSNNKIEKIENLDKLPTINTLCLFGNRIKKMENFEKLICLTDLDLSCNDIKKIEELNNLTHLRNLRLTQNRLSDIPLSILNLTNLEMFLYCRNPIRHIPANIERFLNRLSIYRIYNEKVGNNIYGDNQNVHNSNVQKSFRDSLEIVIKNKPLNLELVLEEIRKNNIINEKVKCAIYEYCEDDTIHSTYLITFGELLCHIWSYMTNNEEIIKVFNDNMKDAMCKCFTGRLIRLISTLDGFVEGVRINIGDNEQISNIIVTGVKNGKTKEEIKSELLERKYDVQLIDEWIEHL